MPDLHDNRKLYLIGNAHLDPVWLWRWQEGFAEIKATFRSALDRMKEFPEFIFTCACALYYQWVEENAPEMFEEIRERVKEGRWVIAGGWWIQPDCNLPSGESFVRHGLYSQRYFYEKFGRMARTGYNVDSFGHSGMLPQILKKSGLDYYVFMRPNGQEKSLPNNLFWWESGDGSRVMAFRLPFGYSHGYDGYEGDMDDLSGERERFHATRFLERKFAGIARLADQQGIDCMGFYGVGNHGGGPTVKNLELIRRLQEKWGKDRIFHSSPDAYFDAMSEAKPELPVIREDLQHHASGCYSAHSETKASNRRAEHSIATAEKFAAAAKILLGFGYPDEKIRRAWQKILFNQFHDIIGGCSIKEAYRDAGEAYGEALSLAAEILNGAVQKISWSINTMGDETIAIDKEKDWIGWECGGRGAPLVVFNSLPWPVNVPVQINKQADRITDDCGKPLSVQKVRASRINFHDRWDTLFFGSLPALGYKVFWTYTGREFDTGERDSPLRSKTTELENEHLRLEFEHHTGYISRLLDKRLNAEIIKDRAAVPVVLDEDHCDTWAHGVSEFRKEAGKFGRAELKLLEDGPLRVRLRVTSRYKDSVLQQDFILYSGRSDLEVRVRLEWREKRKMLKLSFPVNVIQPKATYEIPYGFMERPVDGEEEPGQQWLDVSGFSPDGGEGYYGLSVINDAKYGYDVKNNDLRMTVVRSPIYAHHFGEIDEYCEYMDQGVQEFKYVLAPHPGDWKQGGTVKKAFELNAPPVQVTETHHGGPMPLRYEGIRISRDNIIAAAFKRAEDGNGYILRCYEAHGVETAVIVELPLLGRKWKAEFGRCEIKTFRIPENPDGKVEETNLIEL